SINSINFTIQSNAQKSCNNQLKIDILNDNNIDTGNNKVSAEFCENSKSYGCFNQTATSEKYLIKKTPFCQRINLSESPGFDLGAWVQKEGSQRVNLKMSLYDLEGNEISTAKCNLPEATTTGSEINCSVNYLTTGAKEYYVCINGDVDTGLYKIKGNSNPSKFCGFFGIPSQEEESSYQIFARGRKFDTMTNVKIENTLSEGTFSEKALSYVTEKYGSDCSNGCIVPIKLISKANQQITLSGLRSRYEKTGGEVVDENFYILQEGDAKITAENKSINLERANFRVSKTEDLGDKIFILKLNSQNIFSKQITIKNISTILYLRPLVVIAAYPTPFEAGIRLGESAENITKYEWDFGDGKKKTTDTNKVEYNYNSVGVYYIKLTITDSTSYQTSKTFMINATSPKDAINQTINNKLSEILSLKNELS
ncbi:MAG: PKD domain-containing protein, partial [archaeon]|nr:PKD domain-containing protein [archaeon]